MRENYYVVRLVTIPLKHGHCLIHRRNEECEEERCQEKEKGLEGLNSSHISLDVAERDSPNKERHWKKQKFCLFEEYEQDLKTPDEKAAEEKINQDGYYDLRLPSDYGQIKKIKKPLYNSKVIGLVIAIILLIGVLIYSISWML